jgi:hypothetical protein
LQALDEDADAEVDVMQMSEVASEITRGIEPSQNAEK